MQVRAPNIRYVNSEGEFVDADSGEVTAEAQVDEAAEIEIRGGREVVEGQVVGERVEGQEEVVREEVVQQVWLNQVQVGQSQDEFDIMGEELESARMS